MTGLNLNFAASTRAGRSSDNDDRWFADPSSGCFLVADGVGRSNAGGLAADLAVRCLPRLLAGSFGRDPADAAFCEKHIATRIERLSAMIREQSELRPSLGGLGTTIVAAIYRRDRLFIAHLGDSRAYRWSRGVLQRLTQDHNLQVLLERAGEHAGADSERHRLTRYLGMPEPASPDVRALSHSLADIFLLCTDGLTEYLADEEISSMFIPSMSLQATADRLVIQARRQGSTDDATALLVGGANLIP